MHETALLMCLPASLTSEVGMVQTPQISCSNKTRFKTGKMKKGKVYAVRRHNGSLCAQKQPETAALEQQSRKVTLWEVSLQSSQLCQCAHRQQSMQLTACTITCCSEMFGDPLTSAYGIACIHQHKHKHDPKGLFLKRFEVDL